MFDWKQEKFGDIFQKNNDKNNKLEFGENLTISIAQMKYNPQGNGASTNSLKNYKVLRIGDVAFEGHTNKEFQFGRFVVNDLGNGIMSPRFAALRPIDEIAIYFWKYYLHNERSMNNILVRSTKAGTMMNELVYSDLFKEKLAVPEKSEQVKIGNLFSKLDSTITLHEEKLAKLKQLKQGFLQKMFADESGKPVIRFKGFNDDWEQRKLGEIMNVGSVKRIHQSDWKNEGVRFLRARDIVALSKNEEPADLLYIDDSKYYEYSKVSGKVQKGDLLVTGVGSIGVPMLIESNEPIYFKDGNIIWFKNNNSLDGDFFYYSFTSSNIQNFIRKSSGTGTVGTYTIDNGKKTPILIPREKDEQQKIGLFFQQFDSLITLHQRKLNQLKNLKKSLLQNMFI
ncbi:restriction endonuclease subunit S [Ligilactobacillus equi]